MTLAIVAGMDKTSNPPRSPLVRGEGQCSSPDKGMPGGVEHFLPYNKNLTVLARENRKNPTQAEIRMWHEVLRMRQLACYKFLRQKPITNFIVDFYCSELKLVIEIDGDDHAEKAGYDRKRSDVLNGYGLTVVRYANNEVLENIEGVYEDLVLQIQNLTPLSPPLSEGKTNAPPLTRGGREGFAEIDK
ncbi:MAG: endonuclease domain-containing protein [Sulfurimicrobium sp.]|nr:endonuclease domain-containing protein [Sulfurimicrobium sp.]